VVHLFDQDREAVAERSAFYHLGSAG